MPYGLAKGVSSVTDISDVGGLYFYVETGSDKYYMH